MQHKNISETFEIEMWQYLDGNLSEERMKFWDKQIISNDELKRMLQSQREIFDSYKDISDEDLSDIKFKNMIDIATSKISIYETIKLFFLSDENRVIPKLAFVSLLLIASVTILILSNKPNPVNNITKFAFGWNDDSLDNNFANISTKISYLENEDLRKFYIYSRTKDEWDREVFSIDKKINNLMEETNSRAL
jgi:putative lipase involved disintegration of autophagic bodies